ncbi:MAG: aminotransferase class V-fold PLP-dependent enzyme [Emcibacter sp.]|nr:aminotransferase class V-fold PLP-dependent enzyme [Emcibacter sp.]
MKKQGRENLNLIQQIRQSVIGEGLLFPTAFGLKPLIYSDYTASGRSLTFIEDYITENVLPFYANTHSEASATGRQTTAFREQARGLIAKSLNAGDEYAVIFCGAGATAAIQKMIEILNIRIPANLNDTHGFSNQIEAMQRPVVFIGPYEHHSNEVAWRETIVDLVSIPLDETGIIDQNILRQKLQDYADRPLKMGSFSAASNVTGLLTDVKAITRLLHDNGALAFWDYAAAGPYVAIDMAGEKDDAGDSSLDALYISPHKFIGGPGTPGVLVIKRELLTNRVPSIPGGGTVSYVTPESHRYNPAGESREEGGTPAIVESIRAGMVFQLKDAVGAKVIEGRENDMITQAIKRWSKHSAIDILGNLEAPRTSILSFLIRRQGKTLHFGFIDALMNDLFGIQVRGGCSCAGPYGHELLKIDMTYSRAISEAVEAGHLVLKPGWVRLNFNYFIDEETFEYILRAVELIAEHGWKLLGRYEYEPKHGIWRCRKGLKVFCCDLNDISYGQAGLRSGIKKPSVNRLPLSEYIDCAEKILMESDVDLFHPVQPLPVKYEPLRWYALPGDTAEGVNSDQRKSIMRHALEKCSTILSRFV